MNPEASSRYAPYVVRSGPRCPIAVQIRRAVPDDAPAIAVVHCEREGGRPDSVVDAIRASIARDVAKVWVALDEGEVVAYAKVLRVDRAALQACRGVPRGDYLMGLVVAERRRRRGIGSALTRTRLTWIAERGACEAFYVCNALNRPSIELHAAFGFEIVTDDFDWPSLPSAGGRRLLLRSALPRR